MAVGLAYDIGIFEEVDTVTASTHPVRKMRPDEAEKIQTWEVYLKEFTHKQITEFGLTNLPEVTVHRGSSRQLGMSANEAIGDYPTQVELIQRANFLQEARERRELVQLNEEQRRAHDMIEERLRDHIASEF